MKLSFNLLAVSVLFLSSPNLFTCQLKTVQNVHSQSENQIVYLFFKIKKDNAGNENIILEEKKVVKGKLKSIHGFGDRSQKPGDFLVTFSDENGKEISHQTIENPLNPEFEVFGEEMSRYKADFSENEFSLRYAYSEEIKTIKIEKISDSGKKIIFTQTL